LVGLWVRISPGAWMCVSCECCMMSGRGLRYEPIPSPEDCGVSKWILLGKPQLEETWAHEDSWTI
jgi:hypothetical protein